MKYIPRTRGTKACREEMFIIKTEQQLQNTNNSEQVNKALPDATAACNKTLKTSAPAPATWVISINNIKTIIRGHGSAPCCLSQMISKSCLSFRDRPITHLNIKPDHKKKNESSELYCCCERAHLDELWGEAAGDADPVDGGDEAVSGHRAEDERAQLLPLLAEVMRVNLSEEDGQDHGQDRHQVHLPPVLQRRAGQRLNHTVYTDTNTHMLLTFSIQSGHFNAQESLKEKICGKKQNLSKMTCLFFVCRDPSS